MMKKRLVSALLTLCFLLALLPITSGTAHAAESYYFPVPTHTKISQSYQNGHNGIDINADISIVGNSIPSA